MRRCALFFLCGLVCLGLGAGDPPAHDVQQDSPTGTKATVRLQLEVDAPEPWSLSVGDTVKIRCSPSADSDQDEAKRLRLQLLQEEEGSKLIRAEEPASKGISLTLGPVSVSDRGLYGCEGEKYNKNFTVEDAYQLIWVNDPSQTVSLKLLKVNRVKYFYDKTLTIGCEAPDDESEWRIMSANEKTGDITECPNQERSGRLVTCTIPSVLFPNPKKKDPFWCDASTMDKSNILNVTEAELKARGDDLLVTKFEVSPAWFVREGDSAAIECKVRLDKGNNSDKCDLQLIWTKRNPQNDMTVLLSQRASKPLQYSLNNITHEHSGVYTCWDDGTLPNVFSIAGHYFIWVQDDSPPVTIDVLSHNRTMFFHHEEVTMGCQLPSDHSQWKIKGYDKWTGVVRECDKSELSPSRLLTCTVKMGYSTYQALFWCESTTGIRSSVLNITSTVGTELLEAPPLPVMEGGDLTLRCLQRNRTTGEISAVPAFFHHNERNSQTYKWSDDGSVTIKNVTREHEGRYNCRVKDKVETLDRYVTIRARPQEEKTTAD